MPDFGRWNANGGDPSLDDINRSDQFLDALAAREPVYATDRGEAELANLLAGWRDDVRETPVSALVTPQQAADALDRSASSGRRRRLSLAVVGSAAAAVLCLGGFGAIVAGAGPGDALYGLRTMLFGEQAAPREDAVILAAQTEMQEVQQLIEQGDWQAAQDKLQAVSTQVQSVGDVAAKTDLINQWNDLSAKVGTRDPNFTLPPVVVGEPAPAIPPGVTLLELPPQVANPLGSARSELAEVQQLIGQGDWEQAQRILEQLQGQVRSVGETAPGTNLIEQWNDLRAKVGARDPQFTLPSVFPGEPAPVLPPGVTLLEVPSQVPTAPGTSSDTATTSAAETTATQTSEPSASTTSPSPGSPSSTSTSSPGSATTSAAATTSASPSPSTSTSTGATTTAVTTGPTSAVTSTATSSAAAAEEGADDTAGPQPSAAATESVPASTSQAVAPSASATSPQPVSTAAPSTTAPAPEPSTVVTTTTAAVLPTTTTTVVVPDAPG
ncbi:MAG: anti-sigma-D factor RsdA [Actinomycetota bacterium]|nr:anti-sigma-D factor RsdA [Actinomycetota bacterium]